MNLAIVIGVSEYTNPQYNLPGCEKDAEIIYNILVKTEKFDDILYINKNLSSAEVKTQLTEFISKNRDNAINDLFFYYTGHGDLYKEEFYYILSDYEQSKRNQTTLQNEEIDNLFRTLSPSLVIKVIDACKSGTAYIKETADVTTYFKSTGNRFTNCYFLNSSLQDQSSYQSAKISDFTKSFVQSIKVHGTPEIRYKDIMDFITDAFQDNLEQTPFFVVQATYTEKFCLINASLKEYLGSLDFIGPTASIKQKEGMTLLESIKEQASEFLTKDETIDLIEEIRKHAKTLTIPSDIDGIFTLEIDFLEDYAGIIKKNSIGKWLDENEHDFFAKSKNKLVRKDRHTNPFRGISLLAPQISDRLGGLYSTDEYELVKDGFEVDVEVPYKAIKFKLNSKYPNVDDYTAIVIYIVSKKAIRFFYFFTNIVSINWVDKKLNTNTEWRSSEHQMKDQKDVKSGVTTIFSKLIERAKQDLEDKFFNAKSAEGKKRSS